MARGEKPAVRPVSMWWGALAGVAGAVVFSWFFGRGLICTLTGALCS